MKNFLVLSAVHMLIIFPLSTILGQSLTEGTLRLELTDIKTSNPEMQAMSGVMKGSIQVIEFKGRQQKITNEMMGGLMKVQVYQDPSDHVFETYMDMAGQKLKTRMAAEDIEKSQKEAKSMMDSIHINYDKSDRKTILGYDCYKASFEMEVQGQKMKMIVYLTERIKLPQNFIQNAEFLSFPGTPLEMHMELQGLIEMHYVATSIDDKAGENFFKRPEGPYQEMSIEQLQQLGLGGKMGF